MIESQKEYPRLKKFEENISYTLHYDFYEHDNLKVLSDLILERLAEGFTHFNFDKGLYDIDLYFCKQRLETDEEYDFRIERSKQRKLKS